MKPALKFPAKIKHGDSISSGGNFLPGVFPETPALLLAKNDVIPLRSKTNPLLFGPADAAATEEPAPPSLSGHDYSLDFRNIRATRARNTVKVTIADLFLAVTRRTETSHPVPLSTVFFEKRAVTSRRFLLTCYLRPFISQHAVPNYTSTCERCLPLVLLTPTLPASPQPPDAN
ncbi:unnamed protein product [Pleuronectes platessa]|uniref:Uncharacterized protein n=1 Tax=Pleuronectes platessa TaxID=8262 RepID=A0A9N7YJS4_PLEPL|nr:unnamed protein product [Pleuronectes platessa]